jgi:hypothetical protein
MTAMSLFIVGLGLLLGGLGLPMMHGKVPPNSWYGFRIRLTLDNPDIWYPINAWAGKWLIRYGLACAAAGLAAFALPADWLEGYLLGLSIALMAGILTLLIIGSRMAWSLAQARERSADPDGDAV